MQPAVPATASAAGLATWVGRFARDPNDTAEIRFEKSLILVIALCCCLCGLAWSAMYAAVFGMGVTMALPLMFVAVVGAVMAAAARTGKHQMLVWTQLAAITWVSAAISWSIGSLHDSGFVVVWAFLAPIGALFFMRLPSALLWLGQFLVIATATAWFERESPQSRAAVTPAVRAAFYTMNIGTALTVVFAAAAWFVRRIQQERARSDGLLANMLPAAVAAELKSGAATIAEAHPQVTVLFADVAGFTAYSSTVSAGQLVEDLNGIFSQFDALAARHGVEKIKTIGDAYMAACGVPSARADHAAVMVMFALELRDLAATLRRRDGAAFGLRIGVHSGPAVAGVIGTARLAYDLWGDTVNTASRMESHGEVGKVQVSAATAALLDGRFALQSRGQVPVKGKGEMQLFWVEFSVKRGIP